jgi:hypothetical protein
MTHNSFELLHKQQQYQKEITHNSFELLHKQQQYQKVANHTAAIDLLHRSTQTRTREHGQPASQIRLFVAYAQIQ